MILLATGLMGEGEKDEDKQLIQDVEIIDEKWETKLCKISFNIPQSTYYAAGASWPDDTITFCGGITNPRLEITFIFHS